MNKADIRSLISPADARRYLTALTILNDKEKSHLSQIDESSVNQELSLSAFSSEGANGHFEELKVKPSQVIRLPSLNDLLAQREIVDNQILELKLRKFS